MRKLASLLVLLVLLTAAAFAQTRTITGQVKDETGSPIPFASVMIKGTKTGVTADENGFYKITAKNGDVLSVSAAGIEITEASVIAGNTLAINVKKTGTLDEVVVTALGVKREKKVLGYSTQSVSGDNLTFGNGVDVNSALAGKVAGVKLLGSPSSTFDNAGVLIRGPKGFGMDDALYVLDGTVISDITVVNMDNIEDVSVLKGGAATALYGLRASNGVVMLTSKKGKKGGGTSVEFKTGLALEKLGLIPDYQNEYAGGYSSTTVAPATNFTSDGWYTFRYNAARHPASWASWNGQKILEYGADESWGPRIDGTSQYREAISWYQGMDQFGQLSTMNAHPNNVRDFFQTGKTFSTNVALTSSGNGYTTRLSYQNQDRSLIQINSKRMLHQLGFSGTFDVSKKVSFMTDIQYAYDDRNGQPFEGYRNDGLNITQGFNQWFQRQLDIKGMRDYIFAPDGRITTWNIGDPNTANSLNNTVALTTPQYWDNPWYVAQYNYQTSQAQRLTANVGVMVDLFKGLKWNAFARRYSLNSTSDSRIANGGLEQPYYGVGQTQNSEMNYETNFLYKTKFSQDFTVDAMAGMNIRRNTNRAMSTNTVGGLSVPNFFNIRASLQPASVSNSFSRREVWSHYARATFGYKNYLFLDGSIRQDVSSTLFPMDNKFLYGSGSLSFVFTDLLKTSSVSNWLSFGKVRASIAQVGEDIDFAQTATQLSAGTPFNGIPTVSYGNSNQDAPVEPALQTTYEVGTELKFLKNKIGLDVTYYYNKNINKILSVNIPSATGFSSVLINAGEITNKGLEVSVTANLASKKDFSWDAAFNWATTSNKIVKITDQVKQLTYGSNGGAVVYHVEGKEWGTLYGRTYQIDPKNGLPIINANGVVQMNTNVELPYNILPDWTGGFVNTFRYKFLDLAVSLDYQKGGKIFSLTKYYNMGAGLSPETIGINDKGFSWRDYPSIGGGYKVEGSDGNGNARTVYVPARTQFYTNMQRNTENYLFDADYIKIRDIRLGYTFPKSVAQAIKAKNIYLALFVTNPWLISAPAKAAGVDPSELEGSWSESGQLSQTRQFGFNVKFNF
ncbi:SusC/RagA family TonB-linked outer membrane protein [Terrimonas sp. NA20]|uniref:SusC/RagA family TonB-linked outer membrane protein n=1 Tax=Terrimonas ginsenosidimutans TaxID=2908004 RepID=A0ABS9KNY5_9BACT|nr:SusC/RagA family TonB-linked outer membrane protein [Terrimonas ginsenosidimutans]MCG2614004.1 SusC/RagA family TonB-linked outer membrane protein [Terrimonas ginsenosidimutans]